MSVGGEKDDVIPEGACAAPKCKCAAFKPHPEHAMYCSRKDCAHSVEWHHVSAKEIQA